MIRKTLQILVMRLAKQKFHGITALVADGADNILRCIYYILVHAENAGIFLSIEKGGLWPADIKRDALF